MPEVEGRTRDWKTVKKDAKEIVLVAGDTQVSLTFSPFKLLVIVKGKPAVSLNSKGLFDFEHTRAKEVRWPLGSPCAHACTIPHAPHSVGGRKAYQRITRVVFLLTQCWYR